MVEFVWKYVIREVHENEEELHCSGTQRRLVNAADGGLFSDSINAMEEKKQNVCPMPVRRLV